MRAFAAASLIGFSEMAHIELQDVSVEFPLYHASTRSLKNRLIGSMSLGGRIGEDAAHRVCVKALHGLSLSFEHGDHVALPGANGRRTPPVRRVPAAPCEPLRRRGKSKGRVASLFNIALGFDSETPG